MSSRMPDVVVCLVTVSRTPDSELSLICSIVKALLPQNLLPIQQTNQLRGGYAKTHRCRECRILDTSPQTIYNARKPLEIRLR